jgi:hypothetical protein
MSPARHKQNGSDEPSRTWFRTEGPPDNTTERHLRDVREAADDRDAGTAPARAPLPTPSRNSG